MPEVSDAAVSGFVTAGLSLEPWGPLAGRYRNVVVSLHRVPT